MHARNPVDGRNIDPALGVLAGEGSLQRIARPESEHPLRWVLREPASETEGDTYYGLPALKQPVWIWTVPAYFFAGGLSGAANVLGATAQALDGKRLHPLVLRARWTGAIGDAISAGLLIADLGRPRRFLNMMRVFRPTSPMSVGSWILAGCGALSGASALFACGPRPVRLLGNLANYGAGLMGLPLAGYTGVLLGNTAVPLWQQTRRSLPPLFMSSAAASAGSLLSMIVSDRRSQDVARRFGMVGKAAELACGWALEREAERIPRVARPLKAGASAKLWKAARLLTVASLGLDLAPGRGPWKRVAAGLLGLGGALVLRYAIFHAGKASARDPRATFDRQRAKASETAGAAGPYVERVPTYAPPDVHQPIA